MLRFRHFKHRIDILKSLLGFSYANFCTLQIQFGDELVFDNLKPCDVDNYLDRAIGIWIQFNPNRSLEIFRTKSQIVVDYTIAIVSVY